MIFRPYYFILKGDALSKQIDMTILIIRIILLLFLIPILQSTWVIIQITLTIDG